MKNIIKKPWGSEELISKSKKYILKKLIMKKNHRCSLQYHNIKHETIYVLEGKLRVLLGKNRKNLKTFILNKNQTIVVKPKMVHRMEAIKKSVYLEASTPQLSDVVRILDDYNR